MKHSLAASLLTLAAATPQATAAVVDYASGEPVSSSGYYQYHTKWVTTTCYHTITKTRHCSYDAVGEFPGDYETVSPQVYPGPNYNEYNTVYEMFYEAAYPYPSEIAYSYGTAHPYPYDTVCHPETVYSTVYPDSSHIGYHTFTVSGTDETLTGSPVYHTVDSTITELETVTAAPSEGSRLECSADGPWIVNPSFENSPWPGAWFPSGRVDRVDIGDASENPWVAEFSTGAAAGGDVALLEQAIIIPSGRRYAVNFTHRRDIGDGGLTVIVSLGSYTSVPVNLVEDVTHRVRAVGGWRSTSLDLGEFSGPSECVPVVFSIKVLPFGGGGPPTMVIQVRDLELFSLFSA